MTLRDKFKAILVGFEEFGYGEKQIDAVKAHFEHALYDFNACQSCSGEKCRTFVNRGKEGKDRDGYYYALSPEGCALYKPFQTPAFALYRCPGILQRKEAIYAAIRRASKAG